MKRYNYQIFILYTLMLLYLSSCALLNDTLTKKSKIEEPKGWDSFESEPTATEEEGEGISSEKSTVDLGDSQSLNLNHFFNNTEVNNSDIYMYNQFIYSLYYGSPPPTPSSSIAVATVEDIYGTESGKDGIGLTDKKSEIELKNNNYQTIERDKQVSSEQVVEKKRKNKRNNRKNKPRRSWKEEERVGSGSRFGENNHTHESHTETNTSNSKTVDRPVSTSSYGRSSSSRNNTSSSSSNSGRSGSVSSNTNQNSRSVRPVRANPR